VLFGIAPVQVPKQLALSCQQGSLWWSACRSEDFRTLEGGFRFVNDRDGWGESTRPYQSEVGMMVVG
jgi:hypothetical protein